MRALYELDRRAHRMGLIGVKLSSVSALFAGFAIAKLFPEVLSVNVWWFILICIALAVHPLMVFFRHDGRGNAGA